jgi:hypothetical protein
VRTHTNLHLENRLELYETGMLSWDIVRDIEMTVEILVTPTLSQRRISLFIDFETRTGSSVKVLTLTDRAEGGLGVPKVLVGLGPLTCNEQISKIYHLQSRDHTNLPVQLEGKVRLVGQKSFFAWLGNSYLFILGTKKPLKKTRGLEAENSWPRQSSPLIDAVWKERLG